MDEINPEFPRADVALVIGANDVTNPAARRAGTAISGMPILDVDQAKSIIVIKRSMGTGYAGIDNELYVNPKTSMYFADAKKALAEMTAAVKTLVASARRAKETSVHERVRGSARRRAGVSMVQAGSLRGRLPSCHALRLHHEPVGGTRPGGKHGQDGGPARRTASSTS